MANVLSLALKINADATGLNLTPVERALKQLGDETDKVTSVFDKFTGTSEAAARAQEQTAASLEQLIASRREGTISAQEFADGFERIREAATAEAEALKRAAQITEQNLTPLERYDRALEELDAQLQAGRISQDTYARATESAAKGLSDAERAARGFEVATEATADNAAKTTLQFNELSGVFAILPGPLGDIAGRISGLASAGEGLSRIFSGGIAQGFSGLAASVTALINPFTLALAGITAFAAGATAVARGLVNLEDRVERLGRLANQLGVSFDFVQVLEEAGNRTDVSIEQLSGSFARLQNTLAGADEESKKAAAALGRLGISVQEFGDLSEDDRIRLIGQRIAAIEDPAERSAAAIALFGRSGVQLLPFFNELDIAAADMERFGRAVTALDRQRLADFGGGLDALNLAASGLGTSLLLPFTGLAEGISFAIAEIISGITAIVDPIGRILEPVLAQIGNLIELIGTGIGNLGRIIGAVFEPFAVVAESVAAALEPLFDGIFQFLESISDAAVTTAEWLMSFTPIGAIAANVGALGETISRVVTIITTAFQRAGEFVGAVVSRFAELAAQSPALQALGSIISSIFGTVAGIFSAIANAIGGTVGRLLTLAEKFLGIESSANGASKATENLADSADDAAKSANELSEAQKKAADEANRRAEEAQRIADQETRRVNELLDLQAPIDALSKDITATNNEIIRTEAALAEARAAGATEEANRLASRLATLDQLQQSLIDRSEEAAQGFSEGFDAAFADVDKGIGSLINKAQDFGNEGAQAAADLRAGIEAAQEQVRDGILNREAFEAEVERQKQLFEDRVAGLREAAKITEQLYEKESELLQKQFEIEKERAEEIAAIRTGAIQINDIRTGGISSFFDTLKEDPAIAESRKQLRELEKIRQEISALNAERVDILAGTG